jgi:tetratricopeptide (TPR) repeat protein
MAMQGIGQGWIATGLVLITLMAVPALAVEPAWPAVAGDDATGLDATTANRLQALLEQSVNFAKAENWPGVAAAYDALIADPAFPRIPLEARRTIYSSAAGVALDRQDNARSRDLYLQAITANSTDKDDWANLAWVEFVLGENDAAAAHLAEYARRWPDALDELDDAFVFQLLGALDDDAPPRLDLLQSLASADWDRRGLGADYFWFDLALRRVQRGERDLASAAIQRIDTPRELVQLRSDRRFDGLFDPQSPRFDVALAAQRRLDRLDALLAKDPHNLELVTEVASALRIVGGFDRIVALVDTTLRDDPADFTYPENRVWLLNNKATALQQLGQFKEAVALMQHASEMSERESGNVSQSINLGDMRCGMGNWQGALAAIKELENMSDYGQVAMQSVVHCARLQQGDREGAREALAYLRAHRSLSSALYLTALLRESRLDDAAVALIEALDSPQERADALVMVQDFKPERSLPADVANEKRWKALMRREDVRAAIDRVGRSQHYDIQQP